MNPRHALGRALRRSPPARSQAELDELELERLAGVAPEHPVTTLITGSPIHVAHGAAFVAQYRAIFEDGHYAFEAATATPRIVDGGANLGLASLFWKRRFPAAEITAYEADPDVAQRCRQTLSDAGHPDVDVVNAALSVRNEEVSFVATGADTGRIVAAGEGDAIRVPGVRLRDVLTAAPVDLLKLDVEGAEYDLLDDCRDHLGSVERIFVEYHSFAGEPQRAAGLLAILEDAGFRTHLVSDLTSPQPFLRARLTQGIDQLLNVYAFRSLPD